MSAGVESTIWIDVEDFCAYFAFNPRPSGIQRLAFEIKRALRGVVANAGRLRFVRRGAVGGPLLVEVGWDELDTLFHTPPPPRVPLPPPPPPPEKGRRRVLPWIERLPHDLRAPLFRAGLLQVQVARAIGTLLTGPAAPAVQAPPTRPRAAVPRPGGTGAAVQAGDWFLVLGAPWAVPGFAELLPVLKRQHGLSVALLLYDLVPARRPEWCTPGLVAEFDAWLDATLPFCDRLMAISAHTARDVEAYAQERGLVLAARVRPVPIGTGFGHASEANQAAASTPQCPAGLPRPGSYVLFVSTLEARKNHALAVRVWRQLADEVRLGTRRADTLPDLVFAGRVGWLVSDLMQQLENTAWLRGRVRLVRDPTDAELRALYDGCLFTLFPSLFEGWGLPVTESLAAGKPCLSSDAAALPEAGGSLGRYFDPEDLGSAHRAVAALLDDRPGIAAWEVQVRREFRATPWAETAGAVLAALDRPA